jgi:hypothetical protein
VGFKSASTKNNANYTSCENEDVSLQVEVSLFHFGLFRQFT